MEQWEEDYLIWPHVSVTGTKINGPIMRRREGGPWWWPRYQYRSMTDEELVKYFQDTAW